MELNNNAGTRCNEKSHHSFLSGFLKKTILSISTYLVKWCYKKYLSTLLYLIETSLPCERFVSHIIHIFLCPTKLHFNCWMMLLIISEFLTYHSECRCQTIIIIFLLYFWYPLFDLASLNLNLNITNDSIYNFL